MRNIQVKSKASLLKEITDYFFHKFISKFDDASIFDFILYEYFFFYLHFL